MDIQKLVGTVAEVKYHPITGLQTYAPANEHFKQIGEYQWFDEDKKLQKITEEDGIIISLTGKRRPDFVHRTAGGEEITPIEAESRRAETGRRVPEYAVWDYVITDVEQTTGPEEKRDLLESYEQKRKREGKERDQQAQGIDVLGEAINKMTSVLQPTAGAETQSPQELLEKIKADLSPSQYEEMLLDQLDAEKEPEKATAKGKK